jgi:flagellin FlaB
MQQYTYLQIKYISFSVICCISTLKVVTNATNRRDVDKMGKYIKKLKEEDIGSIGIGAMIVFIAMVLVAGIAASVLIQTSTQLESQAMATGQETTAEVSSGLEVVNVDGVKNGSAITLLAITVRPRAGSADIDLAQTVIEISDSSTKNFLTYDGSTYTGSGDIDGNLFTFSDYTATATEFTIIVLEDADNSCSSDSSTVINSGDYVVLGVNTSACFSPGLTAREDVWGMVIPEEGSPGVINFRCPASFTDTVIELQ